MAYPKKFHTIQTGEGSYGVTKVARSFKIERHSTNEGTEIKKSACTFPDIHDPVFKLLRLTACVIDLVAHPERFHTIQTCEGSYGVTKMASIF